MSSSSGYKGDSEASEDQKKECRTCQDCYTERIKCKMCNREVDDPQRCSKHKHCRDVTPANIRKRDFDSCRECRESTVRTIMFGGDAGTSGGGGNINPQDDPDWVEHKSGWQGSGPPGVVSCESSDWGTSPDSRTGPRDGAGGDDVSSKYGSFPNSRQGSFHPSALQSRIPSQKPSRRGSQHGSKGGSQGGSQGGSKK